MKNGGTEDLGAAVRKEGRPRGGKEENGWHGKRGKAHQGEA